MRVEDLLKPISADAPCGEDLLAVDDDGFVDYYFNVEERLPTSYFNMLRGTLFDPKSVDHKAESAQIEPLLKRSRDLRLLAIEAKFQILAGRFKGFAEAVQGMAALLETYPDEVHPTDSVDRKNAIEELDSLHTVTAPLDYAVLLSDRRAGELVYRGYGTAVGKVALREGEEAGDPNIMLGALSSSENAKAVEDLFAQISGLRAALKTMIRTGQARPQPFTPKFVRLDDKLRELNDMVLAARGDLNPEAVAAPAADVAGDDGQPAAVATGGTTGTFTVQASIGDVANHRAAYQMLQTVEHYFATTEPASLALVLVTQSRLLIGRPLVEALDALISSNADYATITFGTEAGFKISMSQMRELSGLSNIQPTEDWAQPAEDDPVYPAIVSRDHAGQVLKQIEDFFRAREPASPIPILLFKARNMLTKDFHALVRELISDA
jgi:type VI secretion system protein ImpA